MTSSISEHQRLALKMAAQWFATLCAGEVSAQQSQKWQHWYQQHEDHRWAWQRVEALQGKLHAMPASLSYQTLNHARQQSEISRRRVLKSLLLLLGVGGSWQLWQSPAGQGLRADTRTATGEIKTLRLSEGSQLMLNTASAANIRFDAQQRLIHLLQGEVSITTAADTQTHPRPFLVETAQGMLRALGTEFVVRENGDSTQLSVIRHAVEVRLQARPESTMIVRAGQTLSFSQHDFSRIEPAVSSNWTRGLLSVSDWRLAEVLTEVARYRHGHLSCDDSVADLRVSGTFLLNDTDRLLTILAQTLPIKIQSMTRYWIKVVAA